MRLQEIKTIEIMNEKKKRLHQTFLQAKTFTKNAYAVAKGTGIVFFGNNHRNASLHSQEELSSLEEEIYKCKNKLNLGDKYGNKSESEI